MRLPLALAVLCSLGGCTTTTVPVSGECQASVVREEVQVAFDSRLRLVALLDTRAPLPADVGERLRNLATTLESGDVNGDGVQDFVPPAELELVLSETPLDAPLDAIVAPHVPVGFTGEHTALAIVLVTSGDLAPGTAEPSAAVVDLHADPDLVEVAVIGGVPAELVAEIDSVDYDAVLADPRMSGDEPVACTAGDLAAAPAREATTFLELLRARGTRTLLTSLCAPDWDGALRDNLLPRAAASLSGACLPRDLPRRPDGRVDCTLTESLDPRDPTPCLDRSGRVESPDAPGDPSRCRIRQVPASSAEPGFAYDDASVDTIDRCGAGGKRIVLTGGLQIAEGATLELECVTQHGDCNP